LALAAASLLFTSAIAFASGTTATGGFATTGAGVGFTLASAIAFALAAASAAIFL
jgi:hypothetical protein